MKYRTKPGVEVNVRKSAHPGKVNVQGRLVDQETMEELLEPIPEEYVAECGAGFRIAGEVVEWFGEPFEGITARVLRSMKAKIDGYANTIRLQDEERHRMRKELEAERDRYSKENIELKEASLKQSKEIEELVDERYELQSRIALHRSETDYRPNSKYFAALERITELEAGIRKFNSIYTVSQDDFDILRALLPESGDE